jgi:hypothetical protein
VKESLDDALDSSNALFETDSEAVQRLWKERLDGWFPADLDTNAGRSCLFHDLLVRLAQEMIDLRRREHHSESILGPAERLAQRRQWLEALIDRIVWKLYGLEETEIALVARPKR